MAHRGGNGSRAALGAQLGNSPDPVVCIAPGPVVGVRVPAPRSYTGDDLIELHLPGNPVLARLLMGEILQRGARPAEPGEFTARAYFNGRLDLTGAEGVAATIAAGSEAELLAARQLLAGELARRLRPAMDAIAQTLALVEVGIDFSDEDVSFIAPESAEQRIGTARPHISGICWPAAPVSSGSPTSPCLCWSAAPTPARARCSTHSPARHEPSHRPSPAPRGDALTAEIAPCPGHLRLDDAGLMKPANRAPGAEAREMRKHGSARRPLSRAKDARALHARLPTMSSCSATRPARPPLKIRRRTCWSGPRRIYSGCRRTRLIFRGATCNE